jgi:DNA modification methylase
LRTEPITLVDDEARRRKLKRTIRDANSLNQRVQALDEIDWDFKDWQTQYLSHKFHSYPARFIPQIPMTFIKLFTKKQQTILDPFCGCGTTLVESYLNKRNSVGVDMNPLAVLISKVKTSPLSDAETRFAKSRMASLDDCPKETESIEEVLGNLPNRKLSKIFTVSSVGSLNSIKGIAVSSEEEGQEKVSNLFKCALSSTIWSLVEGKATTDPLLIFNSKVEAMLSALKKMRAMVNEPPIVEVVHDDARVLDIDSSTIDHIVTSPPYVNAMDYYRIHMYNMHWLGMDILNFKKHEIGGHSHFIANRFRLLSEYLGDMLRSLMEMNRVLSVGGICAIVVSNSSVEYELIESHKFFSSMARKIGFKTERTLFRSIDTTRKYTSAIIGNIDDEYILVLRKMKDHDSLSSNDDFVAEIVNEEMTEFAKRVSTIQGTSLGWRRPTIERLNENPEKVRQAIDTIPKDIRIK